MADEPMKHAKRTKKGKDGVEMRRVERFEGGPEGIEAGRNSGQGVLQEGTERLRGG